MKAIVEGTVSRINANGIGFSVREAWQKREGGEAHRFVSVFMPDRVPVTVIVGDQVRVSGNLRTAVSKRNPQFVDHTIGNATVEALSTGPARSWGPEEPPADEYPPTDPYDDGAWTVAPIKP